MEKFCLENHFVLELYFVGGCPFEEASQLGFGDNKGIIYGIDCVIMLSIFLFLLIIL
jgi:hypothetical protein